MIRVKHDWENTDCDAVHACGRPPLARPRAPRRTAPHCTPRSAPAGLVLCSLSQLTDGWVGAIRANGKAMIRRRPTAVAVTYRRPRARLPGTVCARLSSGASLTRPACPRGRWPPPGLARPLYPSRGAALLPQPRRVSKTFCGLLEGSTRYHQSTSVHHPTSSYEKHSRAPAQLYLPRRDRKPERRPRRA
ncbi:hypothetical protein PVAP13_9NG483914 [Panicum virgatum]|uniref:Uncharacterized protein n=1 Tax=Panicum virgatum TaxID=38727 RepID=A0A8T0MRA2_PANVG|nr:hypothetical protein PVAP13_9NG483914 [Panicum virgatum]